MFRTTVSESGTTDPGAAEAPAAEVATSGEPPNPDAATETTTATEKEVADGETDGLFASRSWSD